MSTFNDADIEKLNKCGNEVRNPIFNHLPFRMRKKK